MCHPDRIAGKTSADLMSATMSFVAPTRCDTRVLCPSILKAVAYQRSKPFRKP
jgi:hypothetical protein